MLGLKAAEPIQGSSITTSLPFLGYFVCSLGTITQVLAGYWDVYSHRLIFKSDPWWNPAHLTLYIGVAILLLGIAMGLRRHGEDRKVARTYFLGYKLAALGAAMELVAGGWNEIWHNVLNLKDPPISPPHSLLTVGMMLASFGATIGLSLDYAVIREVGRRLRKFLTISALVLSFLSIWLVSSGGFIFVSGVYEHPAYRLIMVSMLSIITPLVLLPLIMVSRRLGYASLLGLLYAFVNWFFLVVYFRIPYYHPLSFLGPMAMDIAFFLSRPILKEEGRCILVGLISSLLLSVTYHPFGPSLFRMGLVPALDLLHLLSLLSGSLGGILSLKVVRTLSRSLKESWLLQPSRG